MPGRAVGSGSRSCRCGPCCRCRRRLPVRPFPRCPALPAPSPMRGADALTVFSPPVEEPTGGIPLSNHQGLPRSCRFSPRIPRAWWPPAAPRAAHQQRCRCLGCWGVQPIAVCLSRAHGAVSSCRACGLPCGLRGALWTLHRCGSALPPSQLPHAVGVVGETWLRRDLHPARSAKLRVAHDRSASAAPGSGSDAGADASGRRLQAVVRPAAHQTYHTTKRIW